MADAYTQLVSKIINEQEEIIGPIALEQAMKVEGLQISDKDHIQIVGNVKDVLEKLVNQYAKLFGRASVEVCRDATRGMLTQLSQDQIPQVLL